MSLLLKALKQAETGAQAGKPGPRAVAGNSAPPELELEPVAPPISDAAREWVEPPGLLFGSSGLSPAPPASRSFHLPRLTLVPTATLLAFIVALGYGIYLYLALQPAPLPAPPVAAAHPKALPAPATASILPAPVMQSAVPRPLKPKTTAAARAAVATTAVPPKPVERLGARLARTEALPAAPAAPVARAEDPPHAAMPVFRPDAHAELLGDAHAAYQAGQLDEAQRLYTRAAAETRSTDALLGLAAIAVAQNREQDAVQLYRELLEHEPRNATAQAALLDLTGSTDSLASESRLKTLIDRDPNPHLYQTLGNLYAEQQRWPEAQIAYFEAFRGAPENADYAFNLAVSLDMLRQHAAALTYYERALAIGGIHRYDRGQAETRIRQLRQAL
jgi:tetratricopeptide (TPR) repeat protein